MSENNNSHVNTSSSDDFTSSTALEAQFRAELEARCGFEAKGLLPQVDSLLERALVQAVELQTSANAKQQRVLREERDTSKPEHAEELQQLTRKFEAQVQQERDEYQRKLDQHADEVAALRAEVASLKSQLGEAKKQAKQGVVFRAQLSSERAKTQELETRVSALKAQLDCKKPPATPPNEASVVTIQRAFRGHLDRRGVELEKKLGKLPLQSPSTPLHRQLAKDSASKRKPGSRRVHSAIPMEALEALSINDNEEEDDAVVKPPSPVAEEVEQPTLSPPRSVSTRRSRGRAQSKRTGLSTRKQRGLRRPKSYETPPADAEAESTAQQSDAESDTSTVSDSSAAFSPVPLEDAQIRICTSELHKSGKVIKTTKPAWGLRVEALNAIEALVREGHACSLPNWWRKEVPALQRALCTQLGDLRSSIVRETNRLLICLADTVGTCREFADFLAVVLPVLFKRLYVTIKVISIGCHECAVAMLQRSNTRAMITRCVPKIANAALKDSHSIVRQRCSEYLALVVSQCSDHHLSALAEHSKTLESVLKKVVADGDKDVRSSARDFFIAYEKRFPESADKLLGDFAPQVKRAITRLRNSRS